MTKRKSVSSSTPERASGRIQSISTGVPGFDAVLGGGLPEYSFNLIAGSPGSGKTTLAQQIVFANATEEQPALYFTVLGEPTLKMLRYQQEFTFFDSSRVGSAIQYINLSEEALDYDLTAVLDRIVQEVRRVKPKFVIVDSFRTITGRDAESSSADAMSINHFIQRLALHLTTWEVTSFLIGEYAEQEQRNPVFTVADGVFWLSQVTDRNSVVRKLQIVKARGRATMPGLHTFRITNGGVQIFPRIPEQLLAQRPQSSHRLTTGVPGLDELMGGGIPAGDAVMLVGPAGSGKTTFAVQFAAGALQADEAVVVVVFEEYPEEYLARARGRNQDLRTAVDAGKLRIIYLRPLDLSVDETLAEIQNAVDAIGAQRVVIDSLSGFEVALAPAFREDFRESLYRLVGALTATGVTIFMTYEAAGGYPDVLVAKEKVFFVTDDIIVQHFVEIDGLLRKVLAIHKMRGSEHSHEFRTFEINENGAVVGGPLKNFHGITTGNPRRETRTSHGAYEGLTDEESVCLDMLVRVKSATAEQLSARMGTIPAQLAATLARLEELGYAKRSAEDDRVYRAVAQMGG
ncbi:MAG: ATPase domain-containing protein [bacterium]